MNLVLNFVLNLVTLLGFLLIDITATASLYIAAAVLPFLSIRSFSSKIDTNNPTLTPLSDSSTAPTTTTIAPVSNTEDDDDALDARLGI